jgi:hypothetical protein
MPAHSQIRQIDYTVIFARDMEAMRRLYETVTAFPLPRTLSDRWRPSCDTLPRYFPDSVTSS